MNTDLDLADLTPEQRDLLARRLSRTSRPPGAAPNDPTGPVPASPTQAQLWFLDRLEPGTPVYNVPFALRLRGDLDAAALHRAVNAVIARQAALRTRFVDVDGQLHQVVDPVATLELPVVDVPEAREAERLAREHAFTSFALDTGPLVAVRLLRLSAREHLLLVTAHHIVFDAWSAGVFTEDLVAFYDEFAGGAPARTAALTMSFADHVSRTRRPAAVAAVTGHVAYWREALNGAPPVSTLPPDLPRPAVQTHAGGRHAVAAPDGLARRVADLARAGGVTANAVVLTAVATLLRRATGQDRILLGLPAAGRLRSELEPLVGCFANMLVLDVDFAGAPTVRELIRRTHHTLSAAYAHQEAPYSRVVEEVAPPRDPSVNPLFQVMVTFADGDGAGRSAAGVSFVQETVDNGVTDFDLFLTVNRHDDALDCVLDYNVDLYLGETVAGFGAQWMELLEAFVGGVDSTVDDLPGAAVHRIAVGGTFTVDPVRAATEFWLRYRRVPATVDLVPYGRMMPFLLAGEATAPTVLLLRWEDWLRKHDPHAPVSTAARLLDAAMDDLDAAVRAYRDRSTAPLVLMVCPPSPAYRTAPWNALFARLDDRLALLAASVPTVTPLWTDEHVGAYRVGDLHDIGADELGHVPYTPDGYALLGTLAVRALTGAAGPAWLAGATGPERTAHAARHLSTVADVLERLTPPTTGTDPHEYVAPRTPTEERLAALWQQVLHLERVGVDADFFALGGHSLLATHLMSRVRTEFGRDVSLYTLFTNPTIARLARVLDEAREPAAVAVLPAPPDAVPVLSSSQRRLWTLDQLSDETTGQNTSFGAVLRGPLDEEALRAAVAGIVRRHRVLRTVFVDAGDEPEAVVLDSVDCFGPTLDLSGLAERDRTTAARRRLRAHTARRYDLATGPLLVVELVRLGPELHHLLIGMHHIVCDNTSWSILLEELSALYAGGTARPEPLPVQFGDFAVDQRRWLDSDAVTPHLAYWRERLRQAPPLTIEGGLPRPQNRSDVAGYASVTLPADIGAAVKELARAEGVTPFGVLLAAYALVLHRASDATDLVIGVPTDGRDRPEFEPLIGCFTDLLPLRLDLAGPASLRHLVRRVHTTALEATRHRAVPLATIVEQLRAARDPGQHALLQCVFNLIDLPEEMPPLRGLEVEPLDAGPSGVDFELFLTMVWHGDELKAELAYSADLFTPEYATGMLERLHRVLGDAVAAPDSQVVAARAVAAPVVAPGRRLAVAASYPLDGLDRVVALWSGLLRTPVHVVTAPAGAVLRPMLDPDGPFGGGVEDLHVVLLRWADWLTGVDPTGPRALTEVGLRLDRARAELRHAVGVLAGRSAAPLALVVCPGSDPSLPWRALLEDCTERLRRTFGEAPGVTVVDLADWERRYGPAPDHERRVALAGTVALRQAWRRWAPRAAAVVVDPGCGAAAGFARVLTEQGRLGRRVLLTAVPAEPRLAALVAAGVAEVVPDGPRAAVAGLAAQGLDPASWVIVVPDEETAAVLRATHPEAAVVVPREGVPAWRVLEHVWSVDPPWPGAEPGPREGLRLAGAGAEFTVELAGADLIAAAAAHGYRPAASRVAGKPRTEREAALVAIWAELLRLPEVGIHDDFFDLGGDSLLAMRVIARAAQVGVAVTARDLAARPTVAQLCADAAPVPAGPVAGTDAPSGELPLSAAQEWFCAEIAPGLPRAAHFNHPYYLVLRRPVPEPLLRNAIALLAARHHALRLRFRHDADGWRQWHAEPADAVPFTTHDLSGVAPRERAAAALRVATAEQTALDLTAGPTCRVAHLTFGGDEPDRLLIVAHHLVTDAVSRGILIEELDALCGGLLAGTTPHLPPAATSYGHWTQRLRAHAGSAAVAAELPYWLAQRADGREPFAPDRPDTPAVLGTLRTVTVDLTQAETVALHGAARRFGAGMRDLLVWAVAREAVAPGGDVVVATTGHGREDLFADLDVARTVGWFQVLYPVRLRLDAGDDAGSLDEVRRQLAAVPTNGLGYGLLRYAAPDPAVRQRLAALPPPVIAVNYMGEFGFTDVPSDEELFDVCHEPFGPTEDPAGRWPYRLDLAAAMAGGRLRIELSHGGEAYRPETTDAILHAVKLRLLGLCDPRIEERNTDAVR
jgi:non-ribosomal peptide synthase protein (TIGR01720 family)